MGATFTPDSVLPLIATSEDERTEVTIGVSENSGGSITSLSVTDCPDWLSCSISGNSIHLMTYFNESPFPYQVHSVDEEMQTHIRNKISDVPCGDSVFKYERLASGTLFHYLTVSVSGMEKDESTSMLKPFTASIAYTIEIYANYSVAQNALKELIECQP